MDRVMNTMPASRLRNDQTSTFSELDQEPILLTHHGEAAGILVHPAQWNQISSQMHHMEERIDDLECLVAALQAELELARGEAEVIDVDIDELKTELMSDAVQA